MFWYRMKSCPDSWLWSQSFLALALDVFVYFGIRVCRLISDGSHFGFVFFLSLSHSVLPPSFSPIVAIVPARLSSSQPQTSVSGVVSAACWWQGHSRSSHWPIPNRQAVSMSSDTLRPAASSSWSPGNSPEQFLSLSSHIWETQFHVPLPP